MLCTVPKNVRIKISQRVTKLEHRAPIEADCIVNIQECVAARRVMDAKHMVEIKWDFEPKVKSELKSNHNGCFDPQWCSFSGAPFGKSLLHGYS